MLWCLWGGCQVGAWDKNIGIYQFPVLLFLHPHNTSCHLIAGWHTLSAANFAAVNLKSSACCMVTMAVVQAKVRHDWFSSSHPSPSPECSPTNQNVPDPLNNLRVYPHPQSERAVALSVSIKKQRVQGPWTLSKLPFLLCYVTFTFKWPFARLNSIKVKSLASKVVRSCREQCKGPYLDTKAACWSLKCRWNAQRGSTLSRKFLKVFYQMERSGWQKTERKKRVTLHKIIGWVCK